MLSATICEHTNITELSNAELMEIYALSIDVSENKRKAFVVPWTQALAEEFLKNKSRCIKIKDAAAQFHVERILLAGLNWGATQGMPLMDFIRPIFTMVHHKNKPCI